MLQEIEPKVSVTESVPLQGTTLSALLEQLRQVFAGTHKVTRFVYTRGEPLKVERLVPLSVADGARDSFSTPFQFARQHSRIQLQERDDYDSSLHTLLRAISKCREERCPARFLVCRQESRANQWVFEEQPFSLSAALSLPVYEDPDTPEGCIVVCGSSAGDLISDTEFSVVCRLKD
jgi:hypothetical protein